MEPPERLEDPNNYLNRCFFYPKAFSVAECQRIIQLPGFIHPSLVVDKEDSGSQVVLAARSSTGKHLPFIPENDWIFDKMITLVQDVNQHLKFDVHRLSAVHALEYQENGFYTWHTDMGIDHFSSRKISIIVFLSDSNDYEGGDLQLGMADFPIVPKGQGTMVLFPSYLYHQVTPVTKGLRYSLVGWAHGPCFR